MTVLAYLETEYSPDPIPLDFPPSEDGISQGGLQFHVEDCEDNFKEGRTPENNLQNNGDTINQRNNTTQGD